MSETQVRILQTTDHRCGYFTDRQSRNLLIDPNAEQLTELYDLTIHAGFRRSGALIYRPHCRHCKLCQSTRVLVAEFAPNRAQRRCLKRNADLNWQLEPAQCSPEYLQLYDRYLNARHPNGGMNNPKQSDFEQFLISDWADTQFLTVRRQQQLLAVAVSDRLASGLSSVYSFFEPTERRRSLGTWLILQQLELAAQLNLPFLYLGYWIKDHPKMHYKVNFQPIEVLQDGLWSRIDCNRP